MFIKESLHFKESITLILAYYSSFTLELLNLEIESVKVKNLEEV
jgi:hypothetical protein